MEVSIKIEKRNIKCNWKVFIIIKEVNLTSIFDRIFVVLTKGAQIKISGKMYPYSDYSFNFGYERL